MLNIVHAYMNDMTNSGGSDVTFDAGFDLFTLDNKGSMTLSIEDFLTVTIMITICLNA